MLKMKKVFALTLASALLAGLWGCKNQEQPKPTEPNQQITQTEPTTGAATDATTPLVPLDPDKSTSEIVLNSSKELHLGSDLYITDMGSYTGIYMEDGVDDFVSDIQMIVVKNKSQKDLQLAQINVIYEETTAVFEVTNLPAGQSVVLLDKNRLAFTDKAHKALDVSNMAFFSDSMGLRQDQVRITEDSGNLTVENLTDTVINEVLVYYKNSASDIYYGGITYRTRLTGGLNPGESKTLMAAHFHPGASTVVDVRIL